MANAEALPTDVKLLDEAAHAHELSDEHIKEHFQDHIGIGIFGRSGDKDILFVTTIYHVGGRKWGIKDGAVMQTDLVISDTHDRQMKDNEFVANRMDPIKSFDDFSVTTEEDRIVWKAGNRQVIARPPIWEVKGEHLGVEVDLELTAIGSAVPYHGTWDKLAEAGVAGNEQLAKATGSITYQGETYVLDEGWAVRERTCLGKDFDVPSLLGQKEGYIWGWCFSEALKLFCFAQGGSGHFAGRVFLTDRIVDFSGEHTTVEVLKEWTDPKLRATFATDWRIAMESEEGRLEINVSTWSRYLFGFHLVDGFTNHFGALGRASGTFTASSGEVITIDDQIAYFEQGFATMLPAA